MQLERLRLRSWRGVAEREVDFSEDITLIEGPNEAGKSTLIEALRMLLTEQHSSKKSSIRAVQPVGQDTGSTVCAVFELNGRRFEYQKTFNRNGATELSELGPGSGQWTGREAHEQMTTLLSNHLDLTLWQTLLVDQGAAVDQVLLSHSPSLAQALDSASGSTAESDTDQRSGSIFDAAQSAFEAHYTVKNRKPRFTEQQQVVEALRRDLLDARSALTGLEEDLALEERQQRQLTQLAEHHPALVDNAARKAQQLATLQGLAEQKLELARQDAVLERNLTEQQQALGARVAKRERLEAIQQKLVAATGALAEARARQQPIAEHLAAAESQRAALKRERSQLQQALLHAQLVDRQKALEERQGALARALDQRQSLRRTLRTLEERLAADPMTPEALESLRSAETELEVSEQTLNLAATRYRFIPNSPLRITVDGTERTLEAGEVLDGTIVGTHRLELDTLAELTLKAPAGLSDALTRRDAAAEQLKALRAQLEITTLAAAVAAAERRAASAAERRALAHQLDELLDDQAIEVLIAKAETLGDEQRRLKQQLEAAGLPDTREESPPLAAQQKAISEIDQHLKDQDARIGALNAEQQRTDAMLREAEQQRIVDAATVTEQRRQLDEEEGRISDTALSQQLNELREQREALQRDIEELEKQDSGLSVDDAALLENNARAALARANAQQGELRTALAVTRDRLERARADGRYERVQHLEATLTAAEDALTARERRARAARRLWDTLNQHRDAARSAYLAPLKAQIERLGRLVFGADFSVSLSEDWQITHRDLGGRRLPFDALSIGAQEQLGILLRLAAAQLVAPTGGVPLFLDDTLGYADPERLGAMTNAIALAAETCQIIILTCDPARYAQLGAAAVVRFDR
ncbi:MAG: AAA family ATPase [Pseudomonadota bacterium]